MRLINAEELNFVVELGESEEYKQGVDDVFEEISKAPTVDVLAEFQNWFINEKHSIDPNTGVLLVARDGKWVSAIEVYVLE